jgi:hypothetical protein
VNVLGKLSALMEQWIMEGSIRAETLYGIELLNEPSNWFPGLWDTCKNSFYPDGYHKIRDNYFHGLPDDKRPWVTIMGGFRPNSEFINYMAEPNFHHVSLDQHLYQGFGDVSYCIPIRKLEYFIESLPHPLNLNEFENFIPLN